MTEETLFIQALERPAEDRAAFLDEACASDTALRARLEVLLHAHDNPDRFLDLAQPQSDWLDEGSGDRDAGLASGPQPSGEGPGSRIGPYKLLEVIGEGGMGTVHLAEQTEPVRRRVALKVVKPGMDTKQVVARFEAERQALAMMDHPNIARVFDGGMTPAGRPYFVMELVRGLPITEYCDQQQLSIPERLELFVLVCRAVQDAHQKGIIHRDLKPSNVLVTVIDRVGVPKVIDFGVTKATGQALTEKTLVTGFHQFVGTPLYVSPEQAELSGVDVDTRSDIYSLGVLLYELLTGTTPFDAQTLKRAAFDEMRRIIREEEPLRPSARVNTLGATLSTVSAQRKADPRRLGASLKGELDWVVMKALEKDRGRRYETANDFAADIMRFLTDRPVEARPPTNAYRLLKFARRNRAVLVTTGLVGITMVLAVVVSTLAAVHARRAEADTAAALQKSRTYQQAAEVHRHRAEEQSQRARRAVDEMYSEVAEQWLSNTAGLSATQTRFLEKALAYYQQFADEHAQDVTAQIEAARARYRVGRIRSTLGQLDQAEQAHRAALNERLALRHALPDRPDLQVEVAESLQAVAILASVRGRSGEAEASLRQAIALCETSIKQDAANPAFQSRLASCLSSLAIVLSNMSRLTEAEAVDRRAVEILESLLKGQPRDTNLRQELSGNLLNLAVSLNALDRRTEAEHCQRRAIELLDQLIEEQPSRPELRLSQANTHNNLGSTMRFTGRPEEAERQIRKAIALFTRLVEDEPGIVRYRRDLAVATRNLAFAYQQLGRLDDAESALRQAVTQIEELTRRFPDQPAHRLELGHAYGTLATFLAQERHRAIEAVALERKSVQVFRSLVHDHPETPEHRKGLATSLTNLGLMLDLAVRSDEAIPILEEAIAISEKLARQFPDIPDDQSILCSSLGNLAGVFKAQRRFDDANRLYLRAIEVSRGIVERLPDRADYRRRHGARLHNYGMGLMDQGRADEVLPIAEEAIAQQTRVMRDEPRDGVARRFLRNHFDLLAEAFDALNQPERMAETAERLLRALPENASALAYAANALDRAAARSLDQPEPTNPESHERAAGYVQRARTLLAGPDAAGTGDPEALGMLVRVHAAAENKSLRDPSKALTLARQLANAAPQEADSWTMLALASLRSGDWSSTREAAEKALKLRPGGDDRDYLLLALAHSHLGQSEAARRGAEAGYRWAEAHHVDDRPLMIQLRAEVNALPGPEGPKLIRKK